MAGFKSDENKQLFIKGLREANFTQEEIDREVQDIEGAPAKAAPTDSAPPPAKKENAAVAQPSPFALDTAAPARQLKEMGQSREEQGKTLVDNITPTGGFWPPSKENWPVYALPAAAAAVTATGLGLKSRFFGPEKEAGARVEPTSSDRLPAAAQQPTTHEQWIANLSPEERTLYERSEEAKAVRANALESTRIEPVLEPERPVVAPQTPEQIRQARLAANAQIAQQSMVAAPPPEAAPLQKVEPPTERPVNPKVSALLQPPMAGAVVPEPTVPVEPVATPAAPAEPVATTKETLAAPVATDAERVQALKDLEKPVAKETTEPAKSKKAPKPEYFEGFKKLPGTERQLLGTLGVANNTERAKSLVDALKSTLPEGAALEFPKTEAGVSKGGMPNPQDVMAFTNKHLGTAMKLDEAGKFPADFRYTEENLAKMHQSILDEYANAKTPSAKAAAEKGFATLRSLAGLAGFGALAYGSLEAYKHGKKTGDWTPAGELGLNTIAGAINPALMLGTYMTGLNAGEEQELAKRRYNAMVGGGRGTTPASAYKR